ncbi:hypothetical protein SUDANB121_05497 [Nocardiopsis dassonvillei]|uniref:MFS transporter n=1 Tax=Nocardiopsis dassonvillei TaxID=2014 RepID=UPI003F55CE1E
MDGVTARTRAAAPPPVPENTGDRPPWRRHFALLWSGGALNGLGTMTFTLMVPLLALAQSGSPVTAAWIAAAGLVPNLVLHLPLGVLADRGDPRRMMLAAQTGRLMVIILLVAPVVLWSAPVHLLAAATALHAVCSTLFEAAAAIAIPCLVPRSELASASAKNEAHVHGSQMIGRPLGGFLFGLAAWAPVLSNAFVSLCVLAGTSFLPRGMRPEDEPAPGRRPSLVREFSAGLVLLLRDRLLTLTLVVCTVTNAVFQVVWLVIMLVATDRELPPHLIGAILAATGVGGLLGSVLAPHLVSRVSAPRMVVLCVWTWALSLAVLVLALWLDPRWLMVGLPLTWGTIGFVGAHMNVTRGTYRALHVPPRLLGRVIGTDRVFTSGALPLGMVCGGYLLEYLSPRATSVILLAGVGVIALAVTLLLPVLERSAAGRPRPTGAAAPHPVLP